MKHSCLASLEKYCFHIIKGQINEFFILFTSYIRKITEFVSLRNNCMIFVKLKKKIFIIESSAFDHLHYTLMDLTHLN